MRLAQRTGDRQGTNPRWPFQDGGAGLWLAVLLMLLLVAFSGSAARAQGDGDPLRDRFAAPLPWPGDVATDAGDTPSQPPFDPQYLALMPELRVGIVLDPAAGDFDLAAPFREALERGLRLPVLLVAYRDLGRLQRALVAGEVDYAPLSASAFAQAQRRCGCLVPLVSPRAADGSAGWHSVVLAAENSPVRQLSDLRGARIASGPLHSTGARRVPLAALVEAGIDPETELAGLVVHADPLKAADAVLAGEADVAFGWSSLRGDEAAGHSRGTLRDLAERDGRRPPLRIVWASAPIPNAAHVVRESVPETIRTAIVELLTAAAGEGSEVATSISPFGFVPVTEEDYVPVLATFESGDAPGTGQLRLLTRP